ncbi:MAG TPA: TatD family hydrolase [Candidatus Paceibacterota bacterium]
MVIDIHSHLFENKFDADRDEVFARMKSANVATITVGNDYNESVRSIELAEKYNMWATVGLHPTDNLTEVFDYDKYKALAQNKRVVAIGECGLDYYRMGFTIQDSRFTNEKERQENLFRQQIDLALEVNKPIMVHCREAYEDTLSILKSYILNHKSSPRGNVHFFAGDWETASKFLDMGFALSFTGVLTFTHDYDEVVKNVPSDMFMVETDAPYVAPVPYRGKRNEPTYVLETLKRVAEIRGISPEEVARLSTATARRVFDLA